MAVATRWIAARQTAAAPDEWADIAAAMHGRCTEMFQRYGRYYAEDGAVLPPEAGQALEEYHDALRQHAAARR
jgi:hypothetical protein